MLSIPSVAGSLFLGVVLSLPAPPAYAQASSFPSRQMQIIVPFPAGGSADFFARSVFNKIEDALANQGATLNITMPKSDNTRGTAVGPQRVMVGGADNMENLLPKSP